MQIRTKKNFQHVTRDSNQRVNGFLVPIYNVHEGFFEPGREPQQVYLTVVGPRAIKGPHLHLIRTGFFTCIKGNVRFVVKTPSGYQTFNSGDKFEFLSIEVPRSVPMAVQNLEDTDSYVLNMPNPAWTPTMADEHLADFGDFDFDGL